MTTKTTALPGAQLGPPDYRLSCGDCGIEFDVPSAFVTMRKTDNQTWYCPLGHKRYFPPGKTREQQLEERLVTAKNSVSFWREQEAAARKRESAAKGQVTKLRNRARAGVCPCCNRSFVQLARHMASKHPDFDPEAS